MTQKYHLVPDYKQNRMRKEVCQHWDWRVVEGKPAVNLYSINLIWKKCACGFAWCEAKVECKSAQVGMEW